uniref:Uncharacterized protein n=1 Tax=Anguilla anguilla TaxID=7936 RepID=A0A0E9PZE2_ANGAN
MYNYNTVARKGL